MSCSDHTKVAADTVKQDDPPVWRPNFLIFVRGKRYNVQNTTQRPKRVAVVSGIGCVELFPVGSHRIWSKRPIPRRTVIKTLAEVKVPVEVSVHNSHPEEHVSSANLMQEEGGGARGWVFG